MAHRCPLRQLWAGLYLDVMEWRDQGLVLSGRKFGEGGLILDVLTAGQGRRAGLVHGGASRRRRAQYEPGNTLDLSWTGRLEEQLGRFDLAELQVARAARHLDRPEALSAIGSVTALLRATLDEGDRAGSALYGPSLVLLDALDAEPVWPALYVRWELGLLSTLGFGLDLSECALSGANDGLTHVSPRTGRAVRGSEAASYLDRLLPLPGFLVQADAPASPEAVAQGLDLTGHFLTRRVFQAHDRVLPEARQRLVNRLVRAGLCASLEREP